MASFDHIRNFCIIAHIDHGKSTLADRILQMTNTVAERDMREQVLDRMDLERERGITIKAQAVRIYYHAEDGKDYQFNLIDTPGHVDFTYEVSRSLAACEGAILVVDATQGVEAQTLANTLLALENDLEIVPVLNKIDLPGAEPEKRADEIVSVIGCRRDEILQISAKTGEGVPAVLEAVVSTSRRRRASPTGRRGPSSSTRSTTSTGAWWPSCACATAASARTTRFLAMVTGRRSEIEEVGIFSPDMLKTDVLTAGEVGYIIPGIKEVADLRVGDTLTSAAAPGHRAAARLPRHHAHGVLRRCSPSTERTTPSSATPWRSSSSTMPLCTTSRRRPRLWDSDSAVGSWGSCTWRSSGSAWSGSSTSTCWPPRPTCATRSSW